MTKQRIYISIMTIVIFLLSVVTVGQCSAVPTANAVVLTENNFDNTKVEDDLADIDIEHVKANYLGMSIVEFVEYCYADNVFNQGNYGLYIYVYNPERKILSTRDGANVINMATSYNSKGEPSAYKNKELQYLGQTSGDNAKLFYKFKVKDVGELLPVQKQYNKTHGERRYDIAGIQLREMGTVLAEDYSIGGTWHYTGYAKGYGSDESTLKCDKTELETVDLDVHHTYYLPEGYNGDGVKTQDQLNTVYFAVPKRLKDMYGELCRIQAEWYEYKTKPIFVMGDNTVYNHLINYVGHISDTQYDAAIKYGLVSNFHYSGPHNSIAMGDYIYNAMGVSLYEGIEWLYEMQYLFPTDTSTAGDTVITAEKLLEYINKRSKTESNLILDKYARCMFTNKVGEGRKCGDDGKTEVNIRSDETYKITSSVISQSFWEKMFGIHTTVTTTYNGIEAIKEITADDFKATPQETCDGLFISRDDYDEFKKCYDDAIYVDPNSTTDEEKIVYLFRFAITDTYSSQVTYFEQDPLHTRNNNAYMSMQNVFLDFDIITLTFEREGVYTVIPVVSNPIDIFADVTPPPDFEDDNGCKDALKTVLMVVGIILLVIVVIKLVSWIAKKVKKANNDKASAPKRQTKKRRKKKQK